MIAAAASGICVVRPAVAVTAADAVAASLIAVVIAADAVTDALALAARLTLDVSALDAVTAAVAVAASRICVDSAPVCVTATLADAASGICVVSVAELVTLTDALASSAALDAAAPLNSSSSDISAPQSIRPCHRTHLADRCAVLRNRRARNRDRAIHRDGRAAVADAADVAAAIVEIQHRVRDAVI